MAPPVEAAATVPPGSPAARRATSDDPTRSILLLLLAMVSFSSSDAISKYLGAELPPVQIAWMRWIGFLMIMAPALVLSRGAILRTGAPWSQFGRGLGMVGSAVAFIMALQHLPMATATSMAFAAPLMVTALSIPMLGEKVGLRRWAAVAVGLLGVLIVVRPGSAAFDPAAVFPLASAAAWAFTIIFTRVTARTDGPITTMAYGAIIGAGLLTLAVPFVWTPVTAAHIGWTALMAAGSTLGQYLTVLAYQRAAASLLVPFSYSQIIWSSLAGLFIFGNVPDAYTWTGAAIIIASGIYTAHRERVRARQAALG